MYLRHIFAKSLVIIRKFTSDFLLILAPVCLDAYVFGYLEL